MKRSIFSCKEEEDAYRSRGWSKGFYFYQLTEHIDNLLIINEKNQHKSEVLNNQFFMSSFFLRIIIIIIRIVFATNDCDD